MSVDVEQEQAQGPRTGAISIAAGSLLLLGALLLQFGVASNAPSVSLIRATSPALHGMAAVGATPRLAGEVYLNKHSLLSLLSALITGVGTALIAVPLRYLYFATRTRREQLGGAGRITATYGPLAVGVLTIVFEIVFALKLHTFVHQADHSQHAADQISNSAVLIVGTLLLFLASVALAVAFVIVSLNAMRVGLLSRFMGVLGMICSILFIIKQLAPLPVVQAVWLSGVGLMIAGRGPLALPPAWAAGKAIPWPTQQEMRETRAATKTSPGAVTAPAPVAPPARQNPNASKKRRGKRR